LADLIVEDEDHHKYIIEIDRAVSESFVHKACFNTSRLIVDNLAQREDYTQIIKIFHISLLYFPIGNGKGSVYHGKNIIYEVETNEKLSVHIKNKETKEVFDAINILPEYFFISVPLFNDRLEREIDEWLHVMKYDKIPAHYHSPYMKQVAEKLNILQMTKAERENYSYYQKQVYKDRDALEAAEARGIEKGEAKGREEGIKKTVINMLYQNFDIKLISELTGFSIEQIEKLKHSLKLSVE